MALQKFKIQPLVNRKSWAKELLQADDIEAMTKAPVHIEHRGKDTSDYLYIPLEYDPKLMNPIVNSWLEVSSKTSIVGFAEVHEKTLSSSSEYFAGASGQMDKVYEEFSYGLVRFPSIQRPVQCLQGLLKREDELMVIMPLRDWTRTEGFFLEDVVNFGDDVTIHGTEQLRLPAMSEIICITIVLKLVN